MNTAQKWPEHAVISTHILKMCFAPPRRPIFQHHKVQKWSETDMFCHVLLRNVLRATTPCTFSPSQLPKVFRTRRALPLFTSKCAWRQNGMHFFHISTFKNRPRPTCFDIFYFQVRFAPQQRALFPHLTFQKWSETDVF